MNKRITIKATGVQGTGKGVILREFSKFLKDRKCSNIKLDLEKHTLSLDGLTDQTVRYFLPK